MIKRTILAATAAIAIVRLCLCRTTTRPTSSTRPWPPAPSRRSSAAVEAAGLVETLKGEGPFTVFATDRRGFCRAARGHRRIAAAAGKAATSSSPHPHLSRRPRRG